MSERDGDTSGNEACRTFDTPSADSVDLIGLLECEMPACCDGSNVPQCLGPDEGLVNACQSCRKKWQLRVVA